MSPAPARFTFDLDLGRREDHARTVGEDAMEAMLEAARQAAYADGFTAGEQGATASAARQLATAATALGDRVATLAGAADDARKAALADAVDLATSVARKLAASLVAAQPTREIEALVAECLSSLEAVPHLVIRCHAGLADEVRELAVARVQTSGFSGRLVVMGDPEIAPGDCRLEWVDGGLVRDRASIAAEIDRRIDDFLAARGIQRGTIAGETE